MTGWTIRFHHWSAHARRIRETLCTLGNGVLATRGALEEAAPGPEHYPGTYIAGATNARTTHLLGRALRNEDLVNWPNWLAIRAHPGGGEPLDLEHADVLSHTLTLDMRSGILERRTRVCDAAKRTTTIVSRRIVSMHNPFLAAAQWTVVPEDWSGPLTITSELDGSVTNSNVAQHSDLRCDHIDPVALDADTDTLALTARANESGATLEIAARHRAEHGTNGHTRVLSSTVYSTTARIGHRFTVDAEAGHPVVLEKVCALVPRLESNHALPASSDLVRGAGTFDDLLRAHEAAWARLWNRHDILLHAADPEAQQHVRLHVFHLAQSVSAHSAQSDAGVHPRGLHGEGHHGRIAWDDLLLVPYLSFRDPAVARALLMHRYRRLHAARRFARDAGYAGALYPWEAGAQGEPAAPTTRLDQGTGEWSPDPARLQRHINSGIALAVHRYMQATGDDRFLNTHGIEMLIEIARFWASAAVCNASERCHEIRSVVGPDRSISPHRSTVHNNAYTNLTAAWTLRCAADAADALSRADRARIAATLGLEDREPQTWRSIAASMCVPTSANGTILQHEGAPERSFWDAALLRYLFTDAELADLLHFVRRPDARLPEHAPGLGRSTLARAIDAWVTARTDPEAAWPICKDLLRDNFGGSIDTGIHLGAMVVALDLLVRGCTGMHVEEGSLRFHPVLPRGLEALECPLVFRGTDLWIRLTNDGLRCDGCDRTGDARAKDHARHNGIRPAQASPPNTLVHSKG